MAKTNVKDMTKGSIYKVIIAFAIPLFFSNLFQQLYNAVDSLIVGQFLGKNPLAAVSSSGNLISLFVSFFVGTASGIGVLIAKFFGEKNIKNMRKVIHTGIALGLVCSLILTIIGILLAPVLLKLMNTDADVLPESVKYFKFYFAGVTGMVMYNIFAGILNSLGNSKRTLLYLIISSILNISLDLLFIGVFKMGVEGAAIATSISQILSALLCFFFLIKKGTIYQVKLKEIKFDGKILMQIIKFGVPAGVQNSVVSLANVVVQSNINIFGNNAMAGNGAYVKIEGFAFLPINCFSLALTTFVGQNLGARQYERAKKGSLFGILCSTVLAEIIGICVALFMPYLAKLFSADPEVVELATRQARIEGWFYFLLAYSYSIAAICRGAGKALIPMIIMLSVWCGFRVLYIEIAMALSENIMLIYIAYPLTWGISTIIYFIYYTFSDWVHGFEKKKKIDYYKH